MSARRELHPRFPSRIRRRLHRARFLIFVLASAPAWLGVGLETAVAAGGHDPFELGLRNLAAVQHQLGPALARGRFTTDLRLPNGMVSVSGPFTNLSLHPAAAQAIAAVQGTTGGGAAARRAHIESLQKIALETVLAPLHLSLNQQIRSTDVVISPGSSTPLTFAGINTAPSAFGRARERPVLLVPEGSWVGFFTLAQQLHIDVEVLPTEQFKIQPTVLESHLQKHAGRNTCPVLLLTLPSNPVPVAYNEADLQPIADAIVRYRVPTLVDALYQHTVPTVPPLAGCESAGTALSELVWTIAGNSKSHTSSSETETLAMGAGYTEHGPWREAVQRTLKRGRPPSVAQLAGIEALMTNTPATQLTENAQLLDKRQRQLREAVRLMNGWYGDGIAVHGPPHGMYATVGLTPALAKRAGVASSLDLEALLLASAGIEAMALWGMRSRVNAVRMNIADPVLYGEKSERHGPEIFQELLRRLRVFMESLAKGATYAGRMRATGVSQPQPIADPVLLMEVERHLTGS